MTKQYKISLILPVFNAAKYINKCLKSIIKQTIFDDIEIIIVNDGSTDETEEKILAYSNKYTNIVYLKTSNRGVSNARNIGIKHANGLYTAFIDADDWVDSICYEMMLKNAIETRADIVAAGLIVNNNVSSQTTRRVTNVNHTEDNITAIRNFLSGTVDVQLQDKLFRTSIVKNIFFEKGIVIGEDRLFIMDCLFEAKTVSFIRESFYHYYQNEESVMHKKMSIDTIQCMDYVANRVKEKCKKFSYNLLPYAEALYISIICRLYCSLCDEYPNSKLISKYRQEIKCYKLKDAFHYMSRKHTIALVVAKINPFLFNFLRKNTYLRYMK